MEQLLPSTPTTTSKKVKVIGQQEYINAATGELEVMQVTSIEERDFNFSKIWMRDFIAKLDLVGNQKTKVALWIIEHIDRDNRLLATYREIQDDLGCSLTTVNETMSILMGVDFLRKVRSGLYAINPNVVYKGSHGARMNALTQYRELGAVENEPSRKERIANIKHSIEILNNELERLIAEDDDTTIDAQIEGQLAFNTNGEIIERAVPVQPVQPTKKQPVQPKKKRGRPRKATS